MKNLFTFMTGGLGDIFLAMLHPDARALGHPDEVGYFKAFKKKYPSAKTKVRMWCHNPQGAELFKYDPNVDEVEFHFEPTPHYLRTIPGEDHLQDEDRKSLAWEQPGFYLDKDEWPVAKAILDDGPFVVAHPFAGNPARAWPFSADVALKGICEAGVRTVLVGGTSERAGKGLLVEAIGVKHPLLTNLLGQHTARLHGFLTSRASKFVGTMSAYNCVAVPLGIPSLVFAVPNAQQIIAKNNLSIWSLMRQSHVTVRYGRQSDPVRTIVDFAKG